MEALPLNLQVAGISTVLALIAILVSWLIYGRNPLKTGQPDPLKKPLGFIFTGMENKWFVDEGYKAVFIDPYVDISRFLADVIDWKFWHDWFHDKVIAGTYNWLSNIVLNRYADQKGIDAFANWPGHRDAMVFGKPAQGPERIRALVRVVHFVGRRPDSWLFTPQVKRSEHELFSATTDHPDLLPAGGRAGPALSAKPDQKNALRWTALVTSLVTFGISLWVLTHVHCVQPRPATGRQI